MTKLLAQLLNGFLNDINFFSNYTLNHIKMRRLNMFLLLLLPIFIFSQTNEEFSIFSQILTEKIEKSKKKIVL